MVSVVTVFHSLPLCHSFSPTHHVPAILTNLTAREENAYLHGIFINLKIPSPPSSVTSYELGMRWKEGARFQEKVHPNL